MAYKEYAAAGEQDGAAAETVICVHGLTRNSSDFDALAAHLADKGYRCLACFSHAHNMVLLTMTRSSTSPPQQGAVGGHCWSW